MKLFTTVRKWSTWQSLKLKQGINCCGKTHHFGTTSKLKQAKCVTYFENTNWSSPCVCYPCAGTVTHKHTLPCPRKGNSMDRQVKQLSMQCHVRTVCSTISSLSHCEWSIVDLWLFLVVRQRNGNRLQTWTQQTAAGLLVDCGEEQVRAQWGDRMVLWHWCSKMPVCRSRQHSTYSKTLLWQCTHQVARQVQWCVSSTALQIVSCVHQD